MQARRGSRRTLPTRRLVPDGPRRLGTPGRRIFRREAPFLLLERPVVRRGIPAIADVVLDEPHAETERRRAVEERRSEPLGRTRLLERVAARADLLRRAVGDQ